MSKKRVASSNPPAEPPVLHENTFICADGSVYKGQYIKGNDGTTVGRSGTGTMTFPDGTTYEGAWEEDKMHGTGKLALASGAVYEGHFAQGRFSGAGKYTFADGSTVTCAAWKDGQPTGTMVFCDNHGNDWQGTLETLEASTSPASQADNPGEVATKQLRGLFQPVLPL